MKRKIGEKAPWMVPWRYLPEARALGWPLRGWMYGVLLSASFGLGISFGLLLDIYGLGIGMGAFFAYAIPGELLLWVRQRHLKRMRQLMGEAVRTLHTSYLACGQWGQAVKMSLPYVPSEIQPLFQRIFRQQQVGVPLDQAMTDMPNQVLLSETGFFLEVARLLEQVGGPLGGALLEDVISLLEEANTKAGELAGEVAARQMETRHLFVLFLVELVFFRLISVVYFDDLFHSVPGQLLISALFFLNTGCLIWVRQQIQKFEIQ
ncbi:type II secretion system F family protein [Effusibacillus consociatus]|uniref:Type II secretion system F family protein n=1 Tax=Effusibacillus consociatus TaxID=1117041 RepID=A0ABV9PY12_9BACL